MPRKPALFFFKCSVSQGLYAVSANAAGVGIPTPSGGKWLPLKALSAIGDDAADYAPETAARDIRLWGCHRFTPKGPRDINWGPEGAPPNQTSFA